MSKATVFYSWQSDRPRASNRDIIRNGLAQAIDGLFTRNAVEESPRLEHDTTGQAGTPAISETIFHKIKNCAVFVADVTFIGASVKAPNGEEKQLSNPNVLLELGFAAATLAWDRITLVMNTHYGRPEKLPFDLRSRRFPLTFDLGPNSNKQDSATALLSQELQDAIRACLQADYDRVEDVLSNLSTFAQSLILKQGNSRLFWETNTEPGIMSQLDFAIGQLLQQRVLKCVRSSNESGFGYEWTYLGKQCALKLGLQPVQQIENAPVLRPENVTADLSHYDHLARRAMPAEPPSTRPEA